MHDRVVALCVYLCIHVILKRAIRLLGHHALKCVIDGPRVEGHTPLSPLHDRECVRAYICLKIPCHTLLALCCCQLQVLQEALAGRLNTVPTGQESVADRLKGGRWFLSLAGGVCTWPVVFPNIHKAYPWTLAVL